VVSAFLFELCDLPPAAEALRQEVRAFLAAELAGHPAARRAYTWMEGDRAFSRKVGARGWLGMTWPKKYGGHERTAFERYVVLEEMLVAGAPVASHWIADRQTGPLILRYGTEEQKQRYLPGMARGEIACCIGMSEPDTGSDLASVRTRAERTGDGWRVNGSKIWTSGAAGSDYMIALVRTRVVPGKKHEGLSQLLVDLKAKGITIRPIRDLAGRDHFCEVIFEDAVLPADALVGAEGQGWEQVMAELAYERSGPERYLSCYPLLRELMALLEHDATERQRVQIGYEVARLATLRAMSLSVAGMLGAGANPALEASIVKDQGALFEQALPGTAQALIEQTPSTDADASDFRQMLGHLVQNAPSYSLRGGTREILRGIIARGLGLR